MIKAISYWSFPGGLDGSYPIDKALDEAKSAGFQGLEPAIATTGVLTPETDQKTCETYRAAAEKRGMAMQTLASGMAWAFPATHTDASIRRKAIDLHKAALQRAAWLGAQSMLYVPGAVHILWDEKFGYVRYDDAMRWAKEGIKQLTEVAEKVNVELCIENVWNGMFYSPLEMMAAVDEMKSPKCGIYFDVGNYYPLHQWPPHWVEMLGARIKRVHVKDWKKSVGGLAGFCDLGEGDVPLKESIQALRKIGYNKTIVAEMMPPREGLLEKTSRAMDAFM
jgi:L-ribulose-5-phosphate 3-epimerase